MEFTVRECMRAAGLLFFAILFLQSGLDKITDMTGNLKYVKSVFEKTFLSGMSTPMFYMLTVLETCTGVLCATGLFFLFRGNSFVGQAGILAVIVCILFLFAGQRIARDYAGAASLAGYFAVALIALWSFAD